MHVAGLCVDYLFGVDEACGLNKMHVALDLAQARYHVVSQRKLLRMPRTYVVCSAYHFDCLFEIVCMQPLRA